MVRQEHRVNLHSPALRLRSGHLSNRRNVWHASESIQGSYDLPAVRQAGRSRQREEVADRSGVCPWLAKMALAPVAPTSFAIVEEQWVQVQCWEVDGLVVLLQGPMQLHALPSC